MTTTEIISSFLSLINKITLAVKDADPFVGFQQSADILLKATGTTDVSDALHVLEKSLKSVRSYGQFVAKEKDKELLTNVDYLNKVNVPGAYKGLRTTHYELMTSLVKNAEAILTSEEKYKKFTSKFEKFKERYTKTYIDEHNSKNTLIKSFCKDFQDVIYFKLLQEVESIDKKLVSKSPGTLQDEVVKYRTNVCDTDEERLHDALASYTACIACDHELKGKEEIRREIGNQETEFLSKIREECITSIGSLFSTLETNKPKFEGFLTEENMMKEGNILVKKLQKFEEISPRDLEKVIDLLTILKDILKKTIVEVAPPKPPKPKLIRISDIVSELRTELGERITVGRLLKWLERKYGKKEEILVDAQQC